MAGDWHEAIAKLVLDNAALAWELFTIGKQHALPICTDTWHHITPADDRELARSSICIDAGTRAESIGTALFNERRTDRTIQLAFADAEDLMVVSEVQSEWSKTKYYRLPGYVAKVFQDYEMPVELLIVCKTDKLAARYREGIWMGERSVVTAVAVGPGDLLRITDPEAAGQSVQLAVTTLLMRGGIDISNEPDKLISTTNEILATIDTELAGDYAYLLSRLISERFGNLMEENMKTQSHPWQTAYFQRLHQESLEQGSLTEARRILLNLLGNFSVDVNDAQRQRIEDCTDLHQLEAWISRVAMSIRTCDELFNVS